MPPDLPVHPLRETLIGVVADLGLDLMSSQVDRLLAYLDLLQRWNATYNLTAVRDPQQMLTQHLADCLATVRPLSRQFDCLPGSDDGGPSLRVLDVGSGGGLPGVVLAAMFPRWQIVCVDTVGKKAAFIRQAALELGLSNLGAEHARVESLQAVKSFDVITSRAFSSLADFVQLTQPLLAPQGVWMAMKGKTPRDELSALPDGVKVFHVEPLVVPGLNAERCLVWMRPAESPDRSASNG